MNLDGFNTFTDETRFNVRIVDLKTPGRCR